MRRIRWDRIALAALLVAITGAVGWLALETKVVEPAAEPIAGTVRADFPVHMPAATSAEAREQEPAEEYVRIPRKRLDEWLERIECMQAEVERIQKLLAEDRAEGGAPGAPITSGESRGIAPAANRTTVESLLKEMRMEAYHDDRLAVLASCDNLACTVADVPAILAEFAYADDKVKVLRLLKPKLGDLQHLQRTREGLAAILGCFEYPDDRKAARELLLGK